MECKVNRISSNCSSLKSTDNSIRNNSSNNNNDNNPNLELYSSVEANDKDINNGAQKEDNNNTNSPSEDQEEQQHFFDIINTFRHYKCALNRRIGHSIDFINQMPARHQEKLANYRAHLDRLQLAVAHNFEVIKVIIGDVANMFKNAVYMQNKHKTLVVKAERELETDRINSVLNQIVREWTNQGATERDTCFQPILSALDRHFSKVDRRHEMNVLVPGAGLGRLAYEIAKRGYSCQGNEFSMMMLFVSNFILNKCEAPDSFTLYPWVSQFSNNLDSAHQLTTVTFPDIDPSDIPDDVNFSMAAGSFTEIYANDCEKWDCVVTCFFLDTAPNVVAYIETISHILRSGGLWINFGPLLYHYADMPDPSIEPSYEIIRDIILSSGFAFLEEQTNLISYYTRNPNSMLSYQYKSVFFVCRKQLPQPTTLS